MFIPRTPPARSVMGRRALRAAMLLAILALLGANLVSGQILSKEYVRLNGRVVAIEVPPPVVTLLNVPAGGSYQFHNPQQTVSFRVDAAGGLDHVEFFLDNLWNSHDSCYVEYWPASNTFYFSDPADNLSSYTLGPSASPPSVSNYACTLDLVHSSLTATATSVTMNLVITLLSSSVGTQNVYVTGVDSSYNSSLNDSIPRASWTAFDEITTAPPTYTLINTLTSSNSQTLSFKFSDGNGFRYIDQSALAMVAYDSLGNNSPCYLYFLPNEAWASLMSSTNGVVSNLESGHLGQPGGSTTHPCSVDLANSKIRPESNPNTSVVTDIYLDLVVSLDTTVTHPLSVYAADSDRAGRGVVPYVSPPGGGPASQVGTWP